MWLSNVGLKIPRSAQCLAPAPHSETRREPQVHSRALLAPRPRRVPPARLSGLWPVSHGGGVPALTLQPDSAGSNPALSAAGDVSWAVSCSRSRWHRAHTSQGCGEKQMRRVQEKLILC